MKLTFIVQYFSMGTLALWVSVPTINTPQHKLKLREDVHGMLLSDLTFSFTYANNKIFTYFASNKAISLFVCADHAAL